MSNNDGLVFEEESNSPGTRYVEIKADARLVERLRDSDKERILQLYEDGNIELGKLKNIDGNHYQIRSLEMGPNKGDLVAELVFSHLGNHQLLKAYTEDIFQQKRLILVFNDMQEGSRNIQVQTKLLTDMTGAKGVANYASSFIDRIPNIKIGTPMLFKPKKNQFQGNTYPTLSIEMQQNNSKIGNYFYAGNEAVNDKPKADLVKGVGGVEKKDFTKVIEFQLDILKKFSKELEAYWNNGQQSESKELVTDEENLPF